MKKLLLIFIFLFSVCIPTTFASSVAGIIPGQIWYSEDSFSEGDTIKIYTAIWNNNKESITVKVEFYDKNVVLGTREIVILPDQVKDASVSWKVTSGDHTISAKIISSIITGKASKGQITLDRTSTIEDKKYIPAVVTKIDGTPATSADVVKSQFDKANLKIGEVIPDSVSKPVSGAVSALDTFRDETSVKIDEGKDKTKKQITELEGKSSTGSDGTEKPIAYLKLFFLSIVSFIFGYKIVFYGLIILLIFWILRSVYLKLRYR